jgi:hypothetical protein
LARNIGKQFTNTSLFLSSVQEEKEIEDDEDGGSKNSEDDGSDASTIKNGLIPLKGLRTILLLNLLLHTKSLRKT